ncbi:alpha/beta hydrolase [Bradyrhizobium sp.]|uniref:alpha/beta hydrolase n=1 Tax=Bradyrhizobium sp. TaxID=376 RepID=UPI003C3FF11C
MAVEPTIVLVHGAFEDASIWWGVIERLQPKGHLLMAFGNPCQGVAVDAAYLRSVLSRIDGPVLLVGHSYGGAVITQAGDDPKVKGLVYAGSILPAVGESSTTSVSRFPGSSFFTSVEQTDYSLPDGTSGSYLLYQVDKFHAETSADVPADRAALMAVTQRPMHAAALNEPVTVAAWTSKPSWQVRTLDDVGIPPATQKFEGDRAGSHVTEVHSSHAVTVSHPDVVADVIEQAVRAVVS